MYLVATSKDITLEEQAKWFELMGIKDNAVKEKFSFMSIKNNRFKDALRKYEYIVMLSVAVHDEVLTFDSGTRLIFGMSCYNKYCYYLFLPDVRNEVMYQRHRKNIIRGLKHMFNYAKSH
jgi:hypothetical protein